MVAGGTSNVTVGSFTLQPSSGNVSLQNIGLQLNSNNASSSDLASGVITIWNGSTQIGQVNFNGKTPVSGSYIATSTISGVNIAQNVQTTITLKASIASIGNSQSGTSGHEILVGLSDANGTSGSSQVDSGAGSMPTKGNGVGIFANFPSVAQVSLPSNGNNDGQLIQFTVTASSGGNGGGVGIGKLVFNIASSTGVTITNPQLFYGTSANPSTLAQNGLTNATTCNALLTVCTTSLTSPLEIPAGTTWYFLLKAASVAYSGTNNTYSITTTLAGDTSDLAPVTVASSSAGSFVWSPNSTTTSSNTSTDWSNGYGVTGLPQFGISQSRSN
jgi:hypothetical protein